MVLQIAILTTNGAVFVLLALTLLTEAQRLAAVRALRDPNGDGTVSASTGRAVSFGAAAAWSQDAGLSKPMPIPFPIRVADPGQGPAQVSRDICLAACCPETGRAARAMEPAELLVPLICRAAALQNLSGEDMTFGRLLLRSSQGWLGRSACGYLCDTCKRLMTEFGLTQLGQSKKKIFRRVR